MDPIVEQQLQLLSKRLFDASEKRDAAIRTRRTFEEASGLDLRNDRTHARRIGLRSARVGLLTYGLYVVCNRCPMEGFKNSLRAAFSPSKGQAA